MKTYAIRREMVIDLDHGKFVPTRPRPSCCVWVSCGYAEFPDSRRTVKMTAVAPPA